MNFHVVNAKKEIWKGCYVSTGRAQWFPGVDDSSHRVQHEQRHRDMEQQGVYKNSKRKVRTGESKDKGIHRGWKMEDLVYNVKLGSAPQVTRSHHSDKTEFVQLALCF